MVLIQTHSRKRSRLPGGSFLFFALLAVLIGGFIYFGMSEVEIEQNTVSQTITYEQLQTYKADK